MPSAVRFTNARDGDFGVDIRESAWSAATRIRGLEGVVTAQLEEILILDGEPRPMMCCPPLPLGHLRLLELPVIGEDSEDNLFSSACWRGYQGTWKIADGKLFLVGLRGRYQLMPGEPMAADWVSGILRVPMGEVLEIVDEGFRTICEEELRIKVLRGVVVHSRRRSHRGLRRWLRMEWADEFDVDSPGLRVRRWLALAGAGMYAALVVGGAVAMGWYAPQWATLCSMIALFTPMILVLIVGALVPWILPPGPKADAAADADGDDLQQLGDKSSL